MSFGFSVGDFVTLGLLAWDVYKSCKDAPEGFRNIHHEVLSLHAVLKEVEETFSKQTLSASRQSRLKTIGDGCRSVLEDLQHVVDRYHSLGTKDKRTWDRMGWGSNDISELRSRLTSNVVVLTAFISTSQVVVEQKLDLFLQELQDGKHDGLVITTQAVESLSTDERQTWRTIREKLEDIWISVAAFDANKAFIISWFKTAINNSAFEEQNLEDDSNSVSFEDDLGSSTENVARYPASLVSTAFDRQETKLAPRPSPQRTTSAPVAALRKWLFRYDEALIKAARAADEDGVRLLLGKGVDKDAADAHGATALYHAVCCGNVRIVQLLLNDGANTNAVDIRYLALHKAVLENHESIVRLLLNKNADVNKKDWDGWSPLDFAVKLQREKLVQLLLEEKADVNTKDEFGESVLHHAVLRGNEKIVQLLLEKNAYVNAKNENEKSVLHCAAEKGYEKITHLLLDNKADVNAKNNFGESALHFAAGVGHNRIVQLLLENKADINAKQKFGNSALDCAARNGHKATVHLLLSYGLDINAVGARHSRYYY